ncbi:hypothetical protein [Paeniglutamicibacter cryotolerans]|uniref:Uncharacterized protein n=1 Tax=Paeniglutamicibacter cryotolerans TaxID=670079 RepID=A0A839QN21_9MICC|nr:hypothetical protein [Paeniglutamicibacter cryotolerans]MBB2995396.1 hypothetical protein [Paeniglutamicibacter cryotolerans]
MSGQTGEPSAVRRGRTSISKRSLQRVTTALGAETLNVPATLVDVELADHEAELVLSMKAPIGVTATWAAPGGDPGGDLISRVATARQLIADRVTELTGHSVSRIDFRLTGLHPIREKRLG